MSVDTKNRRASCIGFAQPWLSLGPAPDGSLANVGDRAQMACSYPGDMFSAPPVFVEDNDMVFGATDTGRLFRATGAVSGRSFGGSTDTGRLFRPAEDVSGRSWGATDPGRTWTTTEEV